ncbi:hypothetical protein KP509_1Z232300 [Ceratopteris richardii]|nr:hypothetical protein KP509_1Z232300 [Ceratopteris richardii]
MQAAELGAKLEKKEVELFDLRGKINDLQLDIDRQTSEFQYLETVAVGLQKQREEAKHVLHSVEDLILNIQAEIELKDQDIHKDLPNDMIEGYNSVLCEEVWHMPIHR